LPTGRRSRIVTSSSEYGHTFDNRTKFEQAGETMANKAQGNAAVAIPPEHIGNVKVTRPQTGA